MAVELADGLGGVSDVLVDDESGPGGAVGAVPQQPCLADGANPLEQILSAVLALVLKYKENSDVLSGRFPRSRSASFQPSVGSRPCTTKSAVYSA